MPGVVSGACNWSLVVACRAAAVPCARAAASRAAASTEPAAVHVVTVWTRRWPAARMTRRSGWASRTMIPFRGRERVLHRVYDRGGEKYLWIQEVHGKSQPVDRVLTTQVAGARCLLRW